MTKIISVVTLVVSLALCLAQENDGSETAISQLRDEVAELRMKVEKATTVPQGWLMAPNGYIYLIHSGGITGGWSSAREYCQRQGGDIVSVGMRNAETARFLVNEFTEKNYWIGLSDIEEEGSYKWADGVSVDGGYTNWNETQPDNSGGNEDCIHVHKYEESHSYKWNDISCNKVYGVVCEKQGCMCWKLSA